MFNDEHSLDELIMFQSLVEVGKQAVRQSVRRACIDLVIVSPLSLLEAWADKKSFPPFISLFLPCACREQLIQLEKRAAQV